jgi:hypothetical protein
MSLHSPHMEQRTIRASYLPSITDWMFASIFVRLMTSGASALLADGDTGWHIRAGEFVLETGHIPRYDLFSFTMQGERWFAWEWLADVILALVHYAAGLQGVVLLTAVVIAATAAVLLRYMTWLGVNLLIGIAAVILICSASNLHWLARPHMFTWGFLLCTIWLLEADRRQPRRSVFLLVPLATLWTNIHGGFVALLVTVGIYGVGTSIEQCWESRINRLHAEKVLPPAVKRYGLLFTLCLAATFANPHFVELHRHVLSYLQSGFILERVQEFQSPEFRGRSMAVYEAVLLLGLLVAALLLRRREATPALLILCWAHASLVSARHIPLFMIVATPWLAREVTLWIDHGARSGNSWLRALSDLGKDYRSNNRDGSSGRVLGWFSLVVVGVMAVVLYLFPENRRWKSEFPEVKFPTRACDVLGDSLKTRRVLSSDQWGDYLIYRFHPEIRVFIDGRSDFYAASVRNDYLDLLDGHWNWQTIMDRYGFQAALIPVEWALGSVMKLDSRWRLLYDDGQALYFERELSTLKDRACPEQPGQGRSCDLEPLSRTVVPVTLRIGGVTADISFTGLAPGFGPRRPW